MSNDLDPARGMVTGILIGGILYALAGLTLWVFW
jgi:hypothetical protein